MSRTRAALLCAALLAAPLASVARADFDVTNRWVVRLTSNNPPASYVCTWNFTQAGGDLTASGACGTQGLYGDLTGAIDPALGTITGSGSITDYSQPSTPSRTFTLSATVAAAGSTISGTTSGDLQALFLASLCLNGRLDPGEECDDGFATDGCCTLSCTFKGDGAACSSNQCQTATRCRAGACLGTPKPVGTVCDLDRNTCTTDTCDASGACTAGPCSPCCGGARCEPQPRVAGCAGPSAGRGSVDVRTTPEGKRNLLTFTIPRATAISPADLGHPATTTDYDVCLYWIDEDIGSIFLAGARAPAGQACGARSCWREARTGTVTYRNARRAPDGLSLLSIKPGAEGKARVRLVGRGPSLALPEDIASIPGDDLLVELHTADACFSAYFIGPRSDVNSSTEFKSREGYGF